MTPRAFNDMYARAILAEDAYRELAHDYETLLEEHLTLKHRHAVALGYIHQVIGRIGDLRRDLTRYLGVDTWARVES